MFSKDRLFWVSFKTCRMNLVRVPMCVMMPSRPMEGAKMGPSDGTSGLGPSAF